MDIFPDSHSLRTHDLLHCGSGQSMGGYERVVNVGDITVVLIRAAEYMVMEEMVMVVNTVSIKMEVVYIW